MTSPSPLESQPGKSDLQVVVHCLLHLPGESIRVEICHLWHTLVMLSYHKLYWYKYMMIPLHIHVLNYNPTLAKQMVTWLGFFYSLLTMRFSIYPWIHPFLERNTQEISKHISQSTLQHSVDFNSIVKSLQAISSFSHQSKVSTWINKNELAFQFKHIVTF